MDLKFFDRTGRLAWYQDYPDREIDMFRNYTNSRNLLVNLYNQNGLSMDNQKNMACKFKTAVMWFSTLRITPNQSDDPDMDYLRALYEYSLVKKIRKVAQKQCCCSQYIEKIYYGINRTNGNIL